jgi:TolA-binding protein
MNDPPRLIDDSPSEIESALLRAGREYRRPASTHTKTLGALGLIGSSALLAKSSAAASLWSIKSLLAGGAVVGVVAASIALVSAPAPAPLAAPAAAPNTEDAAPLPPAVAPAAADESEPEPEPEPVQPAAAPERRADPAPTPTPTSITAELNAIDAARSAVAAGDGARALELLDDHARRFPRGRLQLEAEVLRIEALARSGKAAVAKQRAKAFVERHPNSVFTPRVKRLAAE